jgi:acyl-CoA thioesterase
VTGREAGDRAPGVGAPATDTEAQVLAERSVNALFERDRASQRLGMRIVAVAPGRVKLTMPVTADMLNGHAICHGGYVFMLADSAFAFACNSHDVATVAAGATIDFLAPAREGDQLVAEAVELHTTKRTGLYEISVTTTQGGRIALFRGRAHRLGRRVIENRTEERR